MALAALHAGSPAAAQQSWAGTWRGELPTPAGALTLVLTLRADSASTIGVPSRGVAGIPLADVVFESDGGVRFRVPADGARFEGVRTGPGRVEGEWLQGGQRIPIEFVRVGEVQTDLPLETRPQTPTTPFPYPVAEVTVAASVRLACTLTLPDPDRFRDPVPGAVLLTVAGPNDRDQTHSGHKPYLVLADHLARHGIASIRCDDRGVGGSGGSLVDTDLDALADDALSMLRRLAAEPRVGPVGAIGNSEGSVVASLAAARAPDRVAFAVLLGGVGVSGAGLIRERLVEGALAQGVDSADAEGRVAPFDSLVVAVRAAGGVGLDSVAATDSMLYDRFLRIARSSAANDPFLPADPEERARVFAGPWYHAQITLDGGEILRRVTVPVLALTGSKDRVNLPAQNLPAMRAALEEAGNPDATVHEVRGLNHVMQTAAVGGPREYPSLEESFAPAALQIITEWILERF